MKTQAVAQLDGPTPAVLIDLMPLRHLRLRPQIVVGAVQRVEDEIGVISRDRCGSPDRIEAGQVRLRYEDQRAVAAGLTDGKARQSGGCRCGGGTREERASKHGASPYGGVFVSGNKTVIDANVNARQLTTNG